MMINCIENNLPVADELLYPNSTIISAIWYRIGLSEREAVRTVCIVRLRRVWTFAAVLKTVLTGICIKPPIPLRAISNPNVFPFNGYQIETNGCRYAHVVLRGGVSYARGGETAYFSNIDSNSVSRIKTLLKTRGLNDFIIADLNHANSGKVAKRQIENVKEVVNNTSINGVMLESYLFEGEKSTEYGVSRTDGCLSIEDTELVFGYLQRF